MNRGKIYFRADGHAKMGLGHVFRSLALANMLNDDFECVFIIQQPLPALKKEILEICPSLLELPPELQGPEEARYLIKHFIKPNDIVVLDGYHFNTTYQKVLKENGVLLTCIDDIHAYPFVSDLVINHAPGINKKSYSIAPYTRLCLGLDYALLRPPFLKAARQARTIEAIKNLFICIGGSDFNNITLKILQSLSHKMEQLQKVHIVIGSAYQFQETLNEFATKNRGTEIHIHKNLSAAEMVSTMYDCQVAIVPASSILYEVVAIKMPVISGFFVDNQIEVYNGFQALEAIWGIGDLNTFNNYEEIIDFVIHQDPKEMILKQQACMKGISKENYLTLFKSLV